MPMYDFYCPQCKNTFEELVFSQESPPCPHCGGTSAERRMSAPSPLKTGAFPFKPGAVHPIAKKMAAAPSCGGGGCGGGGGFS